MQLKRSGVVFVLVAVFLFTGLVGVASASVNASNVNYTVPYSNFSAESNFSVVQGNWTNNASSPSFENYSLYLSRLPSYVVGGELGGQLVTGLLIVALGVGTLFVAGINIPSTVVVGSLTMYVLTQNGNLPEWMWPVSLGMMGVGAFLAWRRLGD